MAADRTSSAAHDDGWAPAEHPEFEYERARTVRGTMADLGLAVAVIVPVLAILCALCAFALVMLGLLLPPLGLITSRALPGILYGIGAVVAVSGLWLAVVGTTAVLARRR